MRRLSGHLILLILLLAFQNGFSAVLLRQVRIQHLEENCEESDAFRDMRISLENLEQIQDFSAEHEISFSECLSILMVENDFDLSGKVRLDEKKVFRLQKLLVEERPDPYEKLVSAYEKIFADLRYFPLPGHRDRGKGKQFFFENGYGAARSYGGSRVHEGIDLYGTSGTAGFYPVVSMTDGIIEQIGWLPLGGYRIGVRGFGGGYFYYAHLSSYGKHFEVGDRVSAGELLGLMGDTGYGPEGTSGRFPVHLHLGIYIPTSHHQEMSINPYPILLLMEKQIEEYQY